MQARILLADDHRMFREALRWLLDREGCQVLGEAADGRAAVRLARRLVPDVAVLDFAMPVMNGIDAARAIQRHTRATRTILLTMFEDAEYVLRALRAGVHGYVLKAQAASDLVRAIDEVQRGAAYLSPGISRVVVDAYRNKKSAVEEPLSDRERDVLQLVAEGRSGKEIAQQLGIGFKTVESHRTRLMRKLDIHNTAGLVRYAIRRGLVRA